MLDIKYEIIKGIGILSTPVLSYVKRRSLSEEEFVRCVGRGAVKAYKSAQEETVFVTASWEAVCVEKEIDERVKALYGR